ncbi:MAG: NAD(+)/NADH kinase, partial [Candidatus Dormibacteria bacterium]
MKAPDHGASIGFLLHFRESLESATLAKAREIAEAAQLRTWVAQAEAESVLARELRSARLLVAIGGDGTLLYAAKRAAPRGVPLLGVNRGQLGFLTTVEMAQLPEAIESFVKDRVQLEHRRTLRGEVRERVAGGVRAGVEVAVNEIVVKSEAVNLVRL